MKTTTTNEDKIINESRRVLVELEDLFGWEYSQPSTPKDKKMSGTIAFDGARTLIRRIKKYQSQRKAQV